MRTEYFYDSCGAGKIHAIRWSPECKPKAVLQILHGISEYAGRYEQFARYLNSLGYLVVAEDHMGHGGSIGTGGTQGYFDGGWFAAIDDSMRLMKDTKAEYPDIPYVLFGHSMGSFMARTILAKYPDCGLSCAVICGTAWMSAVAVTAGIVSAQIMCRTDGERKPNEKLHVAAFGGYNKRVEHPRTDSDWLNRNSRCVDAYIADPLCGFPASAGLMRDMGKGIAYIQDPKNLDKMQKDLPVFFIAGGDDPVGNYGKGVQLAADEFRKVGMQNVAVKIYPLCRHEILMEINKRDIFTDIARWATEYTGIKPPVE